VQIGYITGGSALIVIVVVGVTLWNANQRMWEAEKVMNQALEREVKRNPNPNPNWRS